MCLYTGDGKLLTLWNYEQLKWNRKSSMISTLRPKACIPPPQGCVCVCVCEWQNRRSRSFFCFWGVQWLKPVLFISYYGTVQKCNISLRQTKGGPYSTHTENHPWVEIQHLPNKPLLVIPMQTNIPSEQHPQTPAAYKEMNKWKTPTQAKVRVERREGKF